MPEFIPVLVAAVFLFIILLIAFGGVPAIQPTASLPPDRTISLGNNFTVSYITGQSFLTSVDGRVSRGLLEDVYKSVSFDVSNPSDVSQGVLKFKIQDSNLYGRFMVFVNSKEIYSGYPRVGSYTINFDKSLLRSSNVLDIRAESSGWKFWAPTVYIFSANISVNYEGIKTKSSTFNLTSTEVTNIRKARLIVLGNRTGVGHLIVNINGNEVYNGFTTAVFDFQPDVLKEGVNIVDFSSEANTTYSISSADLIVFFS